MVEAKKTFANTSSAHFDAVYVPSGESSVDKLKFTGDALHLIDEAYKHGKAIATTAAGVRLVQATGMGSLLTGRAGMPAQGVFLVGGGVDEVGSDFLAVVAWHRFTNRQPDRVVA